MLWLITKSKVGTSAPCARFCFDEPEKVHWEKFNGASSFRLLRLQEKTRMISACNFHRKWENKH